MTLRSWCQSGGNKEVKGTTIDIGKIERQWPTIIQNKKLPKFDNTKNKEISPKSNVTSTFQFWGRSW